MRMGLPNSLRAGVWKGSLPVRRGVIPKWNDREDRQEESLRNHGILLLSTFYELADLHSANGNDWFSNKRFSVAKGMWK